MREAEVPGLGEVGGLRTGAVCSRESPGKAKPMGPRHAGGSHGCVVVGVENLNILSRRPKFVEHGLSSPSPPPPPPLQLLGIWGDHKLWAHRFTG